MTTIFIQCRPLFVNALSAKLQNDMSTGIASLSSRRPD